MKSIRGRLLVSLALVTVAIFGAAAWTTYALFRRTLLQEFDELLGAKARTLAMLAEPEPDGVAFEFHEHELVDFSRAFDPEFFEAWDEQGKVIVDSGHASRLPKIAPGTLDEPRCRFVTLPDGRRGRMIAVRFHPIAEETADNRTGADWVTLVVARDTEQMDLALHNLAWMLAAVSTVAVGSLLGLLGWIVVRSLRPLDEFAGQMAAIGEFDLATRVAEQGAPTEMIPVINRFNGLLQRIERAFHRERTFSANIAHELRTPLAGLLATIQVALSRNRSSAEYREALGRCEQISHETHRLVEALLALTHLEAGRVLQTGGELDLDELVRYEWQKVSERAVQKGIVVTQAEGSHCRIAADDAQMRIVLANLFDNAIEYTGARGKIEIDCRPEASRVLLTIANGPCDLRAADVADVFELFWRGDAARSETGTHAGLGLALTKRIIEALGGTIGVALKDRQFTATIAFANCPHPLAV